MSFLPSPTRSSTHIYHQTVCSFCTSQKKKGQIKQTKITLLHTYTEAHTHKHRRKQKACNTHTHNFLFCVANYFLTLRPVLEYGTYRQ